jgi:Na+/proline symporter
MIKKILKELFIFIIMYVCIIFIGWFIIGISMEIGELFKITQSPSLLNVKASNYTGAFLFLTFVVTLQLYVNIFKSIN